MALISTILTGLAFVTGTILLAWAVYFTMRALFVRRMGEDTRELAGSVIFRVAALHGLILALVFAQELLHYNQLRSALVSEATAVANIWNDIDRYGTPVEAEVQAALGQYVREVIDREWDMLGAEDGLLADAWTQREIVYLAILDLEPTNARETSLRAHMLEDIQTIAELRQLRENSAAHQMSMLFWFAAIGGILLVTMPYFIFAPTVLNLALLSVYGGFTGLVLYIIYAFANPFADPGALPPIAFETLRANGIGS